MTPPIRVTGSTAEPTYVDVYGLFGEFAVPGGAFSIKYASTSVNPAGRHSQLLEELKPMRERLNTRQLDSLSSLMQRNLNDLRVAQDLVPYLKGVSSDVAFFPAILAVLTPTGYLAGAEQGRPYPDPTEAEDGSLSYDDLWITEPFAVAEGEELLPMGRLRIDRDSAEILVLDGQHRASAFRYLAGNFNPQKDPRHQVYRPFYEDVDRNEGIDAELPVTVIWFERRGERRIDPGLISRKLFVDVNNSAKSVSRARTILLDDRDVTAVGTQVFYNEAASRRYSTDRFSLLHSDFDKDSDLARGKRHPLAVTEPEIVAEALEWAFFGSTRYDPLSKWEVGAKRSQTNRARLGRVFGDWDTSVVVRGAEDAAISAYLFKDPTSAEDFRAVMEGQYLTVLTELFDGFELLTPHYEAASDVANWIEEEGGEFRVPAWERIICGGEGLYWTFKSGDLPSTSRGENYRRAIEEIEEQFFRLRAEHFAAPLGEVNQAFTSFTTKAFVSGYVMAVEHLASSGTPSPLHPEVSEELVERMNSFPPDAWVELFGDYRRALIGTNTTPHDWPAYRNMLLRIYDNQDTPAVIDTGKFKELPEWRMLKRAVESAAERMVDVLRGRPDSDALEGRVVEELDAVITLVDNCGFVTSWLDSDRMEDAGLKLMHSTIDHLVAEVDEDE